jgi:protein O-mannosyl-transferase
VSPSLPGEKHDLSGWLAVAVAIVVAAPSLVNGFAYDDLPLVVENARITTLLPPWEYVTQSYWPAGGLYRPLTVWLLALQWKLGGGAPWIFHATNVALHALVTGLVYLLARRLMPPPWAGVAAVLFAVHPVHVEAVANVVGISELLCSAFVLGSVLLAMRGARDGFTPATRFAVIGCAMLAAVSKEQGFVTPALLLAATVIACPPWSTALRRVAPVAAATAVLLAALLFLRAGVLGGLAGDEPAAALLGLAPSARMLVALGTVPEWTRLLLWPARLSFDYSPPGYDVPSAPGAIHAVALLLLVATAWMAWAGRSRVPAISLGIVWVAIALLPVSNLILPTGILLAERTLYLASVGAVLALAGLAAIASDWMASRIGTRVVLAAVAVVALLGAARSVTRASVWRDNERLLQQVAIEAPRNYRAHRTRALHLDRQGHLDEAAQEYRRSIELWGRDARVYEDLAILLDRQGRDADAAIVLHDGLAVDPAAPTMRSKLYYIQASSGDWPAARVTASAGLAQGDTMFASLVVRADSALAAAAPTPTLTAQ